MASTTIERNGSNSSGIWDGNQLPFAARYGKLMMWFFLLSDAFTFSGLLLGYGVIRFSHNYWPNPDEVFKAFPGGFENAPLVFVGLMTFILIASSVTMVLAVDAGHKLQKDKVLFYMILTIIGGVAFLSCQAWEWAHLINHGCTISGNPFGPNHTAGPQTFGQLFFTITGFHGAHVTSGVILNILVTNNVAKDIYSKAKDYEMVEKVGLYWHFVDLVWVFVFTLFYLI